MCGFCCENCRITGINPRRLCGARVERSLEIIVKITLSSCENGDIDIYLRHTSLEFKHTEAFVVLCQYLGELQIFPDHLNDVVFWMLCALPKAKVLSQEWIAPHVWEQEVVKLDAEIIGVLTFEILQLILHSIPLFLVIFPSFE